MFRTTPLPPLFALAFSVCFATTVSAQYLYGDLRDDFAHDHFDGHYGHDHGSYYGDGHVAYPMRPFGHHHGMPVYTYFECPSGYGNNAVCSEPSGCPFQHGRALPHRPADDYQPSFGQGSSSHNHSHGGDSHSGHSHEGYSHQEYSRDRQVPGSAVAPSDRGYLAPPSLPRGSVNDFQPQQDFSREQPRPTDSIRMDSPPPSSFAPSSPAPLNNGGPSRFTTPPPATL